MNKGNGNKFATYISTCILASSSVSFTVLCIILKPWNKNVIVTLLNVINSMGIGVGPQHLLLVIEGD